MPNERILKKILENGLRLQKERRDKQEKALAVRGVNPKESDSVVASPWVPPCPPLF